MSILDIEIHRDKQRPYKELYDLVESSLDYLENRNDFGFIYKTITGSFGDKYEVALAKGFKENTLIIEFKSPSGSYALLQIHLIVRKKDKEPTLAQYYFIDAKTKIQTKMREYNLLRR